MVVTFGIKEDNFKFIFKVWEKDWEKVWEKVVYLGTIFKTFHNLKDFLLSL